ncbi:MAG: helix-turn-helix domain-containing protein [Candidatus Binatia bacterium]
MNGKELKRIRKQLGMTQAQLAEALGVSANSVARQERGEIGIREPVAKLVKILAQQKRRG